MKPLPKDPVMLLSFVNMKLRDEYSDLEDFCAAFGVENEAIRKALEKIDCFYNPETNQFR